MLNFLHLFAIALSLTLKRFAISAVGISHISFCSSSLDMLNLSEDFWAHV